MPRGSTTFVLLVACGGLAGLWLLSWAVPLPEPPLGDLAPYDGQAVAFSGQARDVVPLPSGTLVSLESATGRARLFIEGQADLRPGDRVSGRARVQNYRGAWELVADRVRVEPGTAERFGVAQAAAEPWRYLGRSVSLAGRVVRVFNATAHLQDDFGRTTLKVENPPPGLRAGEWVSIPGALVYDPERLEFRFRAANLSG